MNTETIKIIDLPNFLQEQIKVIDGLTKRYNQVCTDFEIEKNCKNQVYHYILKNGLFNDYHNYTKSNPVEPTQDR